jgi:hypothetical protein
LVLEVLLVLVEVLLVPLLEPEVLSDPDAALA